MKNTEYKDVFDIGEKALSMENKFSTVSFPSFKNAFTIGENIRGMSNVSPLATVKFFNQSTDDVLNKYYPDSQTIKRNNNLILDENVNKNGFSFYKYEFFSDKNRNGSVENSEELIFKLLLFVSTNGNKVRECYEVVKPADDEIIFFIETDDDTLSDDVLFGRTSEKIKKLYTDHSSGKLYKTFFDGDILDKIKKHAGNINQEIIEELFLKGFIEKKGIKQGFFTFLKYTLMGISAPAKALGWVLNKLGNGIDFLKISDEVWDTENEAYYFQKDKLIENLTISGDKLKFLKDFFTDKKDIDILGSDILKVVLDNIILQQIATLGAFIETYNNAIKEEIEEIFKTLEDVPPSDSPSLSERIALICGIWNGLIDFVSSVCKFFGSLLEAPFNISKNFQQTLEMIDTFWKMLRDGTLYKNMKSSFSYGMAQIVQYLKKKTDDINWVRVYYIGGFSLAFLGTFFIPLANAAKIANAGKLGEILAKINSEVGKTISQTAKFVKVNSIQAYQKVSRAIIDLLEIFRIGGQKVKKFVDDLWKKIAEWFIKNKKILNEYKEKILEKIKKYLKKSKFPIHKTTKMLSKYIGEETGNGWCAPNAVKYLDDVERLEYELAIVDGKLYSKNGRLFDTAFAGEGKIITQKAIFVMDKEGRIFATNAPERFYFHHSSFLGGEEVAAAGEIKVSQGVIEFISKQSGHYQPTKKYMLQFMKVLEENSIDVNKIIVEF